MHKHWIFALLMLAGGLLLGLQALAQPPRLLVLGDSLSAGYGIDVDKGWVQLLQERLREEGYPHRVVNASVSGETTAGGLKRLPRLLEEHQPQWVLLELGGNDGLRGQPVADMKANLKKMVTLSRAEDARVILLGMQIPPNYGPRYTEQFTRAFPQLADELSLPLVEFMLEGVAARDEYMQNDGIHPNAKAQPLILDNVWPRLETELKASE